jgi:hypothetical protein
MKPNDCMHLALGEYAHCNKSVNDAGAADERLRVRSSPATIAGFKCVPIISSE